MRYLVVRYEYNSMAQAENRVLYAYDTENDAVKQFHSVIYQDMNTESVERATIVVMREDGATLRLEQYKNPSPVYPPEPEPPVSA